MKATLFVVFVLIFLATAGVTLWGTLAQWRASVDGKPREFEHLGKLVVAVIIESAGCVVALWKDLFGLRDGGTPGTRRIRLAFEEMVDARKLSDWKATCTFIDSRASAGDGSMDERVEPRIIVDDQEGSFLNLKVPRGKDRLFIKLMNGGASFEGSLSLDSAVVTLRRR